MTRFIAFYYWWANNSIHGGVLNNKTITNTIWHSYLLFIHNLLPVFNTVLSHFIFFLSDTRASPSHSYGSNPGGRRLLTQTSHGKVEGRSHISKRRKKIKSNKNYLKEKDSTFLFSFLLVEIIRLQNSRIFSQNQ